MPVSPHYRPDPRYHALDAELYDPVTPAVFPAHQLRFRNQAWAKRIGLDTLTDAEWCRHLAGFEPLPDNLATPLALRYHGHQFRTYNPELGDGRGFLFAQVHDVEDGRLLDLGTKGSGRTPWSRGADGRLTLKGGVREVLASEMLEAMGCYTSRSLSLVETGEPLVRHDEPSPARSSVLVRLSHSHVRIGTFQRLALRGERDVMKRLVDYVIEQYWPLAGEDPDPVAGLMSCVVRAVAQMGAEWWVAGFVHGVVNSDNVVLTGESFDYGPWRFLPRLDPGFTAAYFDEAGLYAFGRQPGALLWNLEQLARSLAPLSRGPELQRRAGAFQSEFDHAVIARTFTRLGLQAPTDTGRARALVGSFYDAMQTSGIAFQRPFFDLVGGASEERLQASPASGAYRSDAWRRVIDGLRRCDPLPACTTLHTEPYWQSEGPLEMLVDRVESVWQSIAEADDWSPFREVIDAVRAMGRAHRALGYSPEVLRERS